MIYSHTMKNTLKIYVCVCVFNTLFTHSRHLGPALLRVEARVWPNFYFCTTLAGHITEWCVSLSVYVLYCSVICQLWCEESWKENPMSVLAFSYWKASRGPQGLMSPSNGQITINGSFLIMRIVEGFGILRFNPRLFGTKIAIQVLLHHSS